MSDTDTGAADDGASEDGETPPGGEAGGSSEEATDDRVGEALSDAGTGDEETARRDVRGPSAAEGGDGGPVPSEDAAAPDVDESRVFDTLQDEYDATDFEDIAPEVERQFPGEIDFDHLVADDVDLDAEGEEPWLAAEEGPTGGTDRDAATEITGDNAVADVVADIRSGTASDEEVDALREALGVDPPRHVDVRLRHVQSRVDDLAAYIETLETFIDEEGTPIQILERARERLETLEGQLGVVKTGLVNARTERQSLEDRIAALEDAVDPGGAEHFEAELTRLRRRVDDLADAVEGGDDAAVEEVDDLRADVVDALEERRDLRESVEEVRAEQRRIREVFEGIAGEFSEE